MSRHRYNQITDRKSSSNPHYAERGASGQGAVNLEDESLQGYIKPQDSVLVRQTEQPQTPYNSQPLTYTIGEKYSHFQLAQNPITQQIARDIRKGLLREKPAPSHLESRL